MKGTWGRSLLGKRERDGLSVGAKACRRNFAAMADP
ncbi:hypothetical protein M529_06345 [Sphingobium ummariense RL-3]|uniref:Uncharacterized protein n=1 Tax=Sphingobium ummariense RL-3 TaxID=1346791 RepID=T0KFE5_9SPHN|nr:hypothetical protein M529_11110 [Sphingobium ummariense RL-3]EQB33147.1 hypothetical protein M529_06345 [Sphingobium ummariense RL-3]